MIPYFAIHKVATALFISIGVTAVMLLLFGFIKGASMGMGFQRAGYSAIETLVIGAVAAAVSYGVVKGADSGLDI